jgi:hypothetical protein
MVIRLVIVGLFSSAAWACPDLSGHYTCGNDDSQDTVVISKQATATGFNLVFDDSQVVSDDQVYPLEGDPTFRNGSIHTWCDEVGIKTQVVGEYYDGEKKIGSIDMVTSYEIVNGTLIQSDRGQMINDLGPLTVENNQPCSKTE